MNIKTGDTVVLLTGKYEERKDENGKVLTHKVIAVSPKEDKVIVEGVNRIHKHVKPRKQGDTGGIIDAEGAIYASKVALYCSNCGQGVRVKSAVKDGKKIRVCAKCGAETEVPFIPKNDKPVFILQQPSPFKFKVTVTSVSAVFLQIRTFRLPDIINRVISRQESVCNTTGKSVSRHSPSQIPFIPI